MAVRGFNEDIQDNWQNGVITAIRNDRLPQGAVSSAKNGQFYYLGPERALYGTRMGSTLQNTTPNATAFISQYFLNASTDFHLLVDASGNLKKIVTGTISTISATLFTNTTNEFVWQSADSYAYVVNGVDAFKTNGTVAQKFGIRQPVSGDWSITTTAGATAIPTGIYDVVISYYNSVSGHEGPRSDPKQITLAAGQRIQVTLPANTTVADSQVDYTKIYLRQESTTNQYFLVIAGTDVAITGTNGWAVSGSTTVVKIDSSQAQINAFEILAPNVNDNFPPPSGTKYIQTLKGRMFAAKGGDLYWSKPGQPEAFNLLDATEPIGENDGEDLTGLGVLDDTLVMFKQSAVYYLDGDDPQTWIVRLQDKTRGAVNSIGTFNYEGRLYFMSLKGPQMWASLGSEIDDITTQFIGPDFDSNHIDPDDLSKSIIIPHPVQNYVGWAVQPSDQTRNTKIIPFHTKLSRWMSEDWEMQEIRSCAVVKDSTGREWPYIADYDGFIYKLGEGGSDGIPAGTVPNGTVTGSGSTTLTDSTATWTVNAFTGRFATTWNTVNGLRTAQRRRIVSNTATALTVTPAWDNLPNSGDPYNIAGVLFDWKSGFRNGGNEFYRKRLEYVFFEIGTSSEGEDIRIEVYVNSDEDNPVMSRDVGLGTGDLWDDSDWDEMEFSGSGNFVRRIPIHHIGNSWLTRILHLATDEQIFMTRLGIQWLTKTKKIGTTGG